MELFRLTRKKFAEPLSGKGAAIKGARWNSVGVEMIYTAVNRSLAMAEVAVHFTVATLPDDYVMVSLYVPDDVSMQKLNVIDLPDDWNRFPPPAIIQKIGDDFIAAGKFCLLQAPSAVTQGDFNFLVNPNHPDFKRIKITDIVPFPFDMRLFK